MSVKCWKFEKIRHVKNKSLDVTTVEISFLLWEMIFFSQNWKVCSYDIFVLIVKDEIWLANSITGIDKKCVVGLC